jgi:hypothetical protein
VSPILLKKYKPYLVFKRKDGESFNVNNLQRYQKNIPLGPYYLVWDNINNKELLEDGSNGWPYQINEILVGHTIPEALIPSKKDKDVYIKQINLT